MVSFFKKLSSHYPFGFIIYKAYRFINSIIPLSIRLKLRFKRKLGYSLNLRNPKTFNEKIQWLKINDRSLLHIQCADKFAVRRYVADKIGKNYLIPLLLQTTNSDDLNAENLPNFPVIVKTNHDSSGGLFVFDKHAINWEMVREDFKKRLSWKNYGNDKGEWQYENITPCIIVEKLLFDENGDIPSDYKLHCFNGKLAFTQVDLDRSTNHKRNLYDTDWNFMNCKWVYENGGKVEKPKVFEEMKFIAEKFAEDFIYVRVDLYNIGNTIYFGELTFHSDSGNGQFLPQEWDRKIGRALKLPIDT